MNYRTIIVDDEKNCIEVLVYLLEQDYPDLEIVSTFNSSKNALAYLKQNEVDLVFLDIQMPFLTGIELLNSLDEHPFHVVFTTAYDQYAIEAIKLSALDYLLKPIDDDLLKQAIEKFRKIKKNSLQDQIKEFLHKMQPKEPENAITADRIAVSYQDKISLYKADDINYCQSQDNYTTIFLTNGEKAIASKTMKHFEDQLTPLGFLRTHQSYLVNRSLIKEFSRKDGGYLIMEDGTNIPVSRQRKEDILKLFKKI